MTLVNVSFISKIFFNRLIKTQDNIFLKTITFHMYLSGRVIVSEG